MRLLADGRPDPSFGEGAIAVADVDGRPDVADPVAGLADGSVVVGATAGAEEDADFAVARDPRLYPDPMPGLGLPSSVPPAVIP